MTDELLNTLLLQGGYNTNLVIFGSVLLGLCAGVIGSYMLLRKRALVSDAVSHATLPGLCIGFLVSLWLGLDHGRFLPLLLLGALLFGALGALCIQVVKQHTRLTEDTAIAAVLSVFYGLGIVLLSVIQNMDTGARAGLDSFLLGQIATLRTDEAMFIGGCAVITIFISLIFRKELMLLCFDQDYLVARGYSIFKLDLLMSALMLAVVCLGLKTVGLILIIALLIIPPASASLWTNKSHAMISISALFGAISCSLGTAISAVIPNMPTGGLVVLIAAALFFLSLIASPQKGLLGKYIPRVNHGIIAPKHGDTV